MGIYRKMPRYFFHIHNDIDTIDEEGTELPDPDAARALGFDEARNLAAESIKTEGHLVLDHRIDIIDESGQEVASIRFGDAVIVRSEP